VRTEPVHRPVQQSGLHEVLAGPPPGAPLSKLKRDDRQTLHSAHMTAAKPKKPKPLRRVGAARVIAETPATGLDTIVERPDGYYWVGPDGDAEFGPFEDRLAARADRDRYNEEAPSEGETVQEAELEIGIADWIDAETGEPAEGQSPPHLEEP
jgi:hypothetical protein